MKTIKQLEKAFNVKVKELPSKHGFAGKVTRETFENFTFTEKWLFTYDTFSKAQFIRSAKRELEKLK